MRNLLFLFIFVSLATIGCKSSEQKNAEAIAKEQDAVIYSRSHEGKYELYAELNDRDRRWNESNMRQTSTCSDKNKNSAYTCLTGKMSQGTWVWKKVKDNE